MLAELLPQVPALVILVTSVRALQNRMKAVEKKLDDLCLKSEPPPPK